MKITYSILGLLFISILVTWTQIPDISSDNRTITNLPWIIKTDDKGGSSIFGLEIGKATARQAQVLFNNEAEFAIFLDNNGHQSLEAFFNYAQIAGLQARVTLILETNPAELESLASQAIEKKGQQSNSYKLVLPTDLNENLLGHHFSSLTYQPKIKIEQDVLQARFGNPEEVKMVNEQIQQWLYPKKGLSILLAEDEKPVFQYVRPDKFDSYFGDKQKENRSDNNEQALTNTHPQTEQEKEGQDIGKN